MSSHKTLLKLFAERCWKLRGNIITSDSIRGMFECFVECSVGIQGKIDCFYGFRATIKTCSTFFANDDGISRICSDPRKFFLESIEIYDGNNLFRLYWLQSFALTRYLDVFLVFTG